MDVWQLLAAFAGGLLIVWLALLALLALLARLCVADLHTQDETNLRGVLSLLPDVIRLLYRLAADPHLPGGIRTRLWLLLGYLLSPIDLVPDFVPVLGYADDALVVVLTLRSVARRAGPDALALHWPGTPDGLAIVHRLVGLPAPPSGSPELNRGPLGARTAP